MNREIALSQVPQRIAIISSTTAAGYKDFVTHLLQNDFNYRFELKLFPATMQGEKAEESIIAALEHIHRFENEFDAVAIIRGGGSQTDLSCFDSYWLALHVAQFPLPVLTGIGHEQDEPVIDMVAHMRLKTPTAVAAFLISSLNNFENKIDGLFNQCIEMANEKIIDHKQVLEQLVGNFPFVIKDYLYNENALIERKIYLTSNLAEKKIKNEFHIQNVIVNNVGTALKQLYLRQIFKLKQFATGTKSLVAIKLESAGSFLALAGNTIKHTNPENILKKGYSITLLNKKPLKDVSEIKKSDIIETRLLKGKITSEVINVSKFGKE